MNMLDVFNNQINKDDIYSIDDISYIYENVKDIIKYSCLNTPYKYIDIPCAFDIETSSFINNSTQVEEKVAIMYEWTFGICGYIIIGRTWSEFLQLYDNLVSIFNTLAYIRLVIFIHNLGYEFQFFRKYFEWKKVFANKSRQPIYAVTNENIEFRCSYMLSGYGLEKLADDGLIIYKNIKKLVGDLDYDLIRTPITPLKSKEIQYCVNDVKIVMCYVVEKLIENVTIANLPTTKTGFVRRYTRNRCFYDSDKSKKESYFKRKRYTDFIKGLSLSLEDYIQMKRGFQGGFTHGNAWYVDKIMYDVTSYDFTSSYPYVMVTQMFPMSSPKKVDIKSEEEFNKYLSLYCCIFDIEFTDIISTVECENYLSISRCRNYSGEYINNGRVYRADQDWLIIKRFYTWRTIKIYNFKIMRKGYLPKDIVLSILELYKNKTELKDVEGEEGRYLNSKEMVNSDYGMMVTDILRSIWEYSYEWREKESDKNKAIDKYNKNSNRFLYYPWGVWVTAYARKNLFTGIYEFKDDYIYSDTDSIKVKNIDKHINYIEQYNNMVLKQLDSLCKRLEIPYDTVSPKTKKGVEKPLGVWDFDGHYSKFKTLGAKRYMVQYSNDIRNKEKIRNTISLTVSGVNKKYAIPYLIKEYGDEIFDNFNVELEIPEEGCGKMTHTYIDDVRRGVVKDYRGEYYEYEELSSVHLSKAKYVFSRAEEYITFIKNINEYE